MPGSTEFFVADKQAQGDSPEIHVCNGSIVTLVFEHGEVPIDPIRMQTYAGLKLVLNRNGDTVTVKHRFQRPAFQTFNDSRMTIGGIEQLSDLFCWAVE